MAAAPKGSHVSAKARAADVANLRKARAVEKKKPRTARQKAASRQSLVKARAAQKSRRGGKKYVPAKKPQAPPDTAARCGVSIQEASPLHLLPVCGPSALAAHLAWMTGIAAADEEILVLHEQTRGTTLAELCEYAAAEGFAGAVLESFRPCDPEQDVPGLIYGLPLPWGYHAVLGHPAGVVSWGRVLPWPAAPAEAWHLEWRAA
jgi:hypothetical protein